MTIEDVKKYFPEQWKKVPNSIGYCYVTYCLDTSEFYIGKNQAKNFSDRYYGSGAAVKRWKADGLQLDHWPISWATTAEELLEQEHTWVEEAKLSSSCANIRPGGAPAMLGRHHTEESKKKMSESAKKVVHQPMPQEAKDKISASNKGKHTKTEEERKAVSEFHKGRKRSEETCKRIGDSKRGENNPNFGKPRSEETRRKISQAQKGRKFTPEHKAKLRQSRLNYLAKIAEEDNSNG